MTLMQGRNRFLPFLLSLGLSLAAMFSNAQTSASIEKSIAVKKTSPKSNVASAPVSAPAPAPNLDVFMNRRKERIARILITLDRIAAVTAQMKPETADRVEPVLADLAEQALSFANDEALRTVSTDSNLTRLETTVNQLVKTVNRYVEPEVRI